MIEITKKDIKKAVYRAFRAYRRRPEIKEFFENFSDNIDLLYTWYQTGEYVNHLKYRSLVKTGVNGKVRHISQPDPITRVYQHLFIYKVLPLYVKKDNWQRKNCKKGFGITANDRRKSVVSRMKHVYYDRKDIQWVLKIDQRQCYKHVTAKVFKASLYNLTTDRRFIEFATNVCFVNNQLPIGTPSSPVAHHIVMLGFDHFKETICQYSVAYADDDALFFHTKEEAQQAWWRCKNYMWYVCHLRLKGSHVIQDMSEPLDFCGYVFHRNNPQKNTHNKGFVSPRKSTLMRMFKATYKSWPSYFGILKACDGYGVAKYIEENDMRVQDLTSKIKIDRELDALNIDIKELLGKIISIEQYEIRYDGSGNANWVKCLVGIPEIDKDGKETGKILAREFHGNYAGIYTWLLKCEKVFAKEQMLPMLEVEIVNQCGYIIKGSTNQIEYINR